MPTRFFKRAFSAYLDALSKYPYATQILTSGSLWLASDVLSQKLENPENPIDWKRNFRFTFYGFAIAGPLYCWWYSFLGTRLHHKLLTFTKHPNVAKVFLDQCVFGPPELVLFFGTTSVIAGMNRNEIYEKMRVEFLPTYALDCTIWPIIQFLNFKFIPVTYHAVVVNVGALFWCAYLSYVASRDSVANKLLKKTTKLNLNK